MSAARAAGAPPSARRAGLAAAPRRSGRARRRCRARRACGAASAAEDPCGLGAGERGVWSVVIPTYDRLPILRKCLAALDAPGADARSAARLASECAALRHAPLVEYEVVVVDDGSTDGTGEYIRSEQAAGRLGRVVYVPLERNGGATRARNAGVRASRGETIVFIDSDLVPHARGGAVGGLGFLAEHALALDAARAAEPGQSDRAFTYGRVVNTHDFDDPTSEPFKLSDRSAAFFATGNVAISRARLADACALLPERQRTPEGVRDERTGQLEACGPFDAAFSSYGWEDLELGERLRQRGARIAHAPRAVGFHWHPALSAAQLPALLETERQRGANGARFFARHPNWRVALMTQLTPLHACAWAVLTLGGLLNGATLRPLASALCEAKRPGLALALLSPALNMRCVCAAFAEAARMALRALRAAVQGGERSARGGAPTPA